MFVSLLAFAVGAYLAIAESGKIGQATQKINSAQSQLNNLLNSDPAPTESNIESSQQNVAELTAQLESIRSNLQRGARLTASSDGIQVMAAIQQFISEYQRKSADNTNENGEPAPVSLPTNFAFGFEQYITEATPLSDSQANPVLDKQRQIISYLLNQLLAANPQSIVSVHREVRERPAATGRGAGSGREGSGGGFSISPAISASVPGAIDTLGFSLTFTGYTDTLREFLNRLAKFELPIVVRSIEVSRPAAPTAERSTRAAAGRNLDSIFGLFEGNAGATEEAPREAQKPVIAENLSSFTVVLEFIEVVLPDESTEREANQ
ncbi:MAG: hypothetical protein EA353_13340 [Puniceicoccaceae bacterium]|nr:MAG: hypothetical protein EA353_13340 [Puniceicoccaceae bacterium]